MPLTLMNLEGNNILVVLYYYHKPLLESGFEIYPTRVSPSKCLASPAVSYVLSSTAMSYFLSSPGISYVLSSPAMAYFLSSPAIYLSSAPQSVVSSAIFDFCTVNFFWVIIESVFTFNFIFLNFKNTILHQRITFLSGIT